MNRLHSLSAICAPALALALQLSLIRAATGTVFALLGIVFLVIRSKQRTRWSREQQAQPRDSFAPIIAPRRARYGLQGVASF